MLRCCLFTKLLIRVHWAVAQRVVAVVVLRLSTALYYSVKTPQQLLLYVRMCSDNFSARTTTTAAVAVKTKNRKRLILLIDYGAVLCGCFFVYIATTTVYYRHNRMRFSSSFSCCFAVSVALVQSARTQAHTPPSQRSPERERERERKREREREREGEHWFEKQLKRVFVDGAPPPPPPPPPLS